MGKQIPYDDIPDSFVLPQGDYIMAIEGPEVGASHAGKYMITVPMRATDGPVTGMQHWERFAVGTDDDPDADDPNTWRASISAQRFKRMVKAAGVPGGSDIDDILAALDGQQVGVAMSQTVDDGKRDPKYKGSVRNNISAFFAPGERAVGGNGAAPVPAPKAAAKPVAAAKPAVAATQAPAAVRPKAAPNTVKCAICNGMVPRSEFAAHVATCSPADE